MRRLHWPGLPVALLFGYMALFLGFIILPIAAVVAVSFSSSSFIVFPIPGLTLRWYWYILEYRPFVSSLITSIELAVAFPPHCRWRARPAARRA